MILCSVIRMSRNLLFICHVQTVDELETHKENYVTSQTLLGTYYPMNCVKLANNCDFVVQDKNDLKEHAHEVMVIMHAMA